MTYEDLCSLAAPPKKHPVPLSHPLHQVPLVEQEKIREKQWRLLNMCRQMAPIELG